MLKVTQQSKFCSDGRFTAVQEMKQHTGGISFIGAAIDGLTSHMSDCPLVMVDLLAHEGWPAIYGVTEFAKGCGNGIGFKFLRTTRRRK